MSFLGYILSVPYMLLFFGVWIIASLFRPVLLASFLACLWQPRATLYKLNLFVTTCLYLLFCNDKSFKLSKEDPASYFVDDDEIVVDTKTVIFVRHGESLWNFVFNKGKDRSKLNFALYFIPNLLYALAMEYYLFVTGKWSDSWFYDSPLSEKGIGQAEGVHEFLQQSLDYATPREAQLIRLMLGEPSPEEEEAQQSRALPSQLVSSNLRRAIATMAIGFQDRLDDHPNDSILILPQLQEISRNPDALSITPAKGKAMLASTDPDELYPIYKNQIDTRSHSGNKPISTNGGKRLEEFCHVIFDDIDKESIIAGGHSLWFRSFFRAYLPRTFDHVSKKRKLINGGCVGFILKRTKTKDGKSHFLIDPTSITVLHGGF